jgi:hypothetical protein
MKTRSIAAAITGAAVLGAALLFIPVKAAASGAANGDKGALVEGDWLAGYDSGLFRVSPDGSKAESLWNEGEVRKIQRTGSGWYFLTSKGIIYSADLASFESRSAGLPVKTYKLVEKGEKSFLREVQDLKDLAVDPENESRLLTCTKDEVFISEDGGKSWQNLGQPVATTGLKAVSFGSYPGSGEAAVWASHPIKGLYVRKPVKGSGWAPASPGLAMIQGTTSVEEISDMIPAAVPGQAVSGQTAGQAGQASVPAAVQGKAQAAGTAEGKAPYPAMRLWAANSFLPRIYCLDAKSKAFRQVYDSGESFGCVESLAILPSGELRFVTSGAVKRLDPASGLVSDDEGATRLAKAAAALHPDRQLLSLSFPEAAASGGAPAYPAGAAPQSSLSELWLVSFTDTKPFRAAAEKREGLYLATGFMVHPETRRKYFDLMKERGLNAVVVDMKDDFGRLRFEPRDPLLRKMGKTASPLDIEGFAKESKEKGVYLIARVVVFKDEVIYNCDGGKYAIWDAQAKAPWQGYNLVRRTPVPQSLSPTASGSSEAPAAAGSPAIPPEAGNASPLAAGALAGAGSQAQSALVREPIKEYWVDPYSEAVWAYNVAIANEVIARGFDEVQFDYIRFPTDGANIDGAGFRWRDAGMDKESALASFLRYARENISAPISIDIYGANGWYRSGVRTGQDVELLAKYVDVICPMYYPSHFEQGFLAQPPATERPYRIYRTGTLRTDGIARGRVVVRPYVQAFYMNVSYDRAYYNLDYVKREVAGVRDAVDLGMTFWNNAGRYDDIPLLGGTAAGGATGAGAATSGAAAAGTSQDILN